jgi:hypothetical protein
VESDFSCSSAGRETGRGAVRKSGLHFRGKAGGGAMVGRRGTYANSQHMCLLKCEPVLTNIIVISVIIKFLMDDVFFYFKFLFLLSRNLSVCSAQDHLKVVESKPKREIALECSCCELLQWTGFKAVES